MDEIKTAQERLASARHSDDLALKAWVADVDYLIAQGFAALRVNPGAAALMDLRYALDPKAWAPALEHATRTAQRLACRGNWRLELGQLKAVAKAALKHLVNPVCPKCCGLKYLEVPGTARLSDRHCPTCHASGLRPFPKPHPREIRDVLAALEADEYRLQDALRRALR